MFMKEQNPHSADALRLALDDCSKKHSQLTKEAAMGELSCPYSEWLYLVKLTCNSNPITLSTAKTLWSFGRFECNRVIGLKQ